MKRAKGKSAADRLEAANSKELQATSKQSRQVRDSSGRHSSVERFKKRAVATPPTSLLPQHDAWWGSPMPFSTCVAHRSPTLW